MPRARKRVLVVDDSPIELKMMSRLLRQAGFDVVIAGSGQQGILLAERDRPDLIILDINMPLMDGYEVCRELKADPSTMNIPVVLYSERDQVIDVLRGLEAGADSFVAKGGKKEEFLDRIRRAIPSKDTSLRPQSLVDLSELKSVTREGNAEIVARLLSEALANILRQKVHFVLGYETTTLIVDRGRRVAHASYPVFATGGQIGDIGYPFDLALAGAASPRDVVEGFEVFASECLLPLLRLGGMKVLEPRDVQEVEKAFKELGRLFLDAYRAQSWKQTDVPQGGSLSAGGEAVSGSHGPPSPPVGETTTGPIEMIVDRNQVITSIDERSARSLGYARSELIGESLIRVLSEPSRKLLAEIESKVERDGSDDTCLHLRRSDGSTLYVRLGASAFYDAQGHFRMSQLVGEILQEEPGGGPRDPEGRLEQVEQALDRKERELGAFLHRISHDLKQPLHVILNMAQLLQEEYTAHLDDTAREYVTTMQSYALRLREMISDIAALARLTAGGLEKAPTDLNLLLTDTLQGLEELIRKRDVRVERTGEWPVVSCDPVKIRQVLIHLIENAIRFNIHTQPRIELQAGRNEHDFVFSVRDNGIGIARKDFERVFEIFQQLNPPSSFSGRGMGLTISRAIVDAHGGRLWLESEPGVGSVLHFTLPAA